MTWLFQLVEWADVESKCICDEAFSEFTGRHQGRDVHVDCTIEYDYPIAHSRLALYPGSNPDTLTRPPCWMTTGVFWVASILFCSWPYRLVFKQFTKEVKYNIVKRISLNDSDGIALFKTCSIDMPPAGEPMPQVFSVDEESADQQLCT